MNEQARLKDYIKQLTAAVPPLNEKEQQMAFGSELKLAEGRGSEAPVDRLVGPELRKRLMAIATNAVREARVALGRDSGPWLDEDASRQQLIFEALHLPAPAEVELEREAFPLKAERQAPKGALAEAIDSLSERLERDRTEGFALKSVE